MSTITTYQKFAESLLIHKDDFAKKLEAGHIVEKAFGRMLVQLDGYRAWALCDLPPAGEFQGPQLPHTKITAPDLALRRPDGFEFFLDVKFKLGADDPNPLFRNVRETGFSKKNYFDYKAINNHPEWATTPVLVAFCHHNENEIRIQCVDDMDEHCRINYRGNKGKSNPTAYFIYDRLPLWRPMDMLKEYIEQELMFGDHNA